MVLIRAETLVPYGYTCDRSAAAKEDDGVRIRGALLPSCWQLKALPGGWCRFSFPKTLCVTLLNCITSPPQSDHLDKFPSAVSKNADLVATQWISPTQLDHGHSF